MQRKLIIRVLIYATVSFLMIVGLFVFYTIMEAPIERVADIIDNVEVKKSQVPPVLEELTSISRNNLENYLLFSRSNEQFINSNLENGNFEEADGNKFFVLKSADLPELFKNECERIFCYQNRMVFSEIPSLFWRGLIGVEDSRFLEHKGVDFKSILRAIIVDIKSMSLVQGGSTITQQLVKNLYFTNEKKLIRKLKELIVAVYLEFRFEKEKILEAYFNEIYWGVKQGVYIKGIYAASTFYFGKKPSDLTEFEVSILISLLKGPNYYNPLNKIDRLQERAKYVFKRLKELNFISDKAIPWNLNDWSSWKEILEGNEKSRPYRSFYFVSKFENETLSSFEKYILLENIYNNLSFRKKENENIQLAVKAAFYDFRDKKSFSFYSNEYRDSSEALNVEKHQVGSILKPIIYSFFIDEGKSLDDLVETAEIPLNLKSGSWSPKEAHSIEETEITLRKALQLSYNRPVIRIASQLGFEKLEPHIESYIPSVKKPLGEYPAQLLGAIELSVNEVRDVYKKFISSECMKLSDDYKLEDTVIFSMSDPGSTTIRRQVGEELGSLRFFGKTGTSNNGNDNWFVGYDGRLLSVFWFGNEGEKSTKNLGLYGSTTAFRIYRNFLQLRGKQIGDIGCHYVR